MPNYLFSSSKTFIVDPGDPRAFDHVESLIRRVFAKESDQVIWDLFASASGWLNGARLALFTRKGTWFFSWKSMGVPHGIVLTSPSETLVLILAIDDEYSNQIEVGEDGGAMLTRRLI